MEMNADERKNARKLLQLRKDLLNRCCPPTTENMTQFWEVTRALQRLSQLNKERTCELAGRLLAIPTYEFESDWCIVSCIVIDNRKPLSVLDDDDCYGSDFYRMGSLLAESDRYLKDHFDTALKIHYLFIQIAHTIRQLLELGSLVYKEVKKFVTKKEISQKLINTLISSSITNLELETNFQLRFDD